MSKKDFIRLADYLRGIELSEDVLKAICSFCRASNSRFKEDVFRGYLAGTCGPSGGKVKKQTIHLLLCSGTVIQGREATTKGE